MARQRAISDEQRRLMAAVGFAQRQLSEGQAVGRIRQLFPGLTNEEALGLYARAFEVVAAGEEIPALDRQANVGLAFGPEGTDAGPMLVEARVTWDTDDGTQQAWDVRMEVDASDSVASIMERLEAEADNFNRDSGKGETVRSVTFNWVLPLTGA